MSLEGIGQPQVFNSPSNLMPQQTMCTKGKFNWPGDDSCRDCQVAGCSECGRGACTKCLSPNLILRPENATCTPKFPTKEGYFKLKSNQSKKQKCHNLCATCFGPKNNQCLSCKSSIISGGNFPILRNRTTCLIASHDTLSLASGCGPGRGFGPDRVCDSCPNQCARCRSSSFFTPTKFQCLQCTTGFKLIQGQCQIPSSTNFYPSWLLITSIVGSGSILVAIASLTYCIYRRRKPTRNHRGYVKFLDNLDNSEEEHTHFKSSRKATDYSSNWIPEE